MNPLLIQALHLVSCLLGIVSPNFRMVSISNNNGKCHILVILEQPIEEDLEEIEDLITEFEAVQNEDIDFDVETKISNEDIILSPFNPDEIVVFRRKEY